MIFVTGDTHGLRDIDKFESSYFLENINKPENIVIITGDFGVTWDRETMARSIAYYSQFDCKFMFIDGNNENFDILNTLPVTEYCGGKVHKVSDNIMHMMRGEIFNFDGVKVLAFGGADSWDSPERYSYTSRVAHKSWWREETPTMDEFYNAMDNLEENDNVVDIILTHETTSKNVANYFSYSITDQTCSYLDEIAEVVDYKMWYFGHHHYDMQVSPTERCIFNDFVNISEVVNLPYASERVDIM